MGINTAQKFGKVELLLKNANVKKSSDFESLTKIEFEDAGLIITGDHIIVVIDEKEGVNNTITSTGKIFKLNDVSSYRTHAS